MAREARARGADPPASAAPPRDRGAADGGTSRHAQAAGARSPEPIRAGAATPRPDAATARAAGPLAPPIRDMPGHSIRRLQQVAVALFAQGLPGLDVTPVQFAALAVLGDEGPCDQATLAARIGYDRATLGGVVDRLEAKRWVARSGSRSDRRVKLVSLTPEGAAALRRMRPAVERVQRTLMAPLTPVEQRRFHRLCRKLLLAHAG